MKDEELADKLMARLDRAKWKVLESSYIANKPWLTVRTDKVALPNGRVIDEYYVHEHPTWVNVIARTKAGEFVFVMQYRHALGEVSYELPAGIAEKGEEDPEVSARRELLEETGYAGGRWRRFATFSVNPATHNNLTHTFLAEDVERLAEPSLDAGEDLRAVLLSREEVLALLSRDLIRQSLMAASLWKYFFNER